MASYKARKPRSSPDTGLSLADALRDAQEQTPGTTQLSGSGRRPPQERSLEFVLDLVLSSNDELRNEKVFYKDLLDKQMQIQEGIGEIYRQGITGKNRDSFSYPAGDTTRAN